MNVFKMATRSVIPITDQLDIEVFSSNPSDTFDEMRNVFSLQQSSFIHRYFL